MKQAYFEQRARGACTGTICRSEAAFDLSVAAQHQSPGKEEIKALTRRLQWQMDNLDRGLHFIPLDLSTAKLFIFVDGSFANNSDLSSQIGYLVVLGNETHKDGEFICTDSFSLYECMVSGSVRSSPTPRPSDEMVKI